jgi:hypothetical protein
MLSILLLPAAVLAACAKTIAAVVELEDYEVRTQETNLEAEQV